MIGLLLAFVLAQAQPPEGEVDRIMLRFFQGREKARSEQAFKTLLAQTRAELEKFLKGNPGHKDAERATFHVAESFLSADEPEKALEKFKAFLTAFPKSANAPAARYAIGEIYLQIENPAASRAAFEDFVKNHGADERALFAKLYIAVTYQNEKKYDEAAKLLLEARQSHKDRKESWSAVLQLAVLYHAAGKNAEARAALEEIIRDCPDREPADIARRHLTEYVKLGKDAPPFVEKDTDKQEQSLEKYRGKVVVLYFFDSAGSMCVAEAAFLRKAKQAFKEDEFQILGVSVDRDTRDLKFFMDEKHVSWPILYDAKGFDGMIPLLYGVRGLPSLWVIDRKGRSRYYNVARADLLHAVETLLQEK